MKKFNNLKDLEINDLHIELVDIDSVENIGFINTIDLSIEIDETFCVNDGIITHNSAKETAVAGLSAVGRDYYGVFPLKGKPLNVRDVTASKIADNDEITKIIQILGLVPGKKYTSLAELRYGKAIFMTDADVDGISIKGLLINFIHKMWPELLDLGFIYEFITPIVIARKGKQVKEYYNISNYTADKEAGKLDGWITKYYKGLGTIKADEIKVMFKNLDKHLIKFNYVKDRDSDRIDMLFAKKRANERKDWLSTYKGVVIPDKFGKPNEITDFVDNEFIQFSNADNIRSIPDLMDGLKPSQRKILFSAFKKNMGTTEKDEMKVAQFGSYTAEVTAYHSGEGNLSGTIVGMAQDFVGANNINLFVPSGQFGTRSNPDASASPRYIFTYLNPLTRLIFRPEDDKILNYLDDDGLSIEPEYYLPIIPMILVNGAAGIGTGWSTDIPKFSPASIIKVIKKKLEKPEIKYRINPSYHKFNGDLEWNEEKNTYITKGVYTKTKKGVLITELPVECWTDKYISFLNRLCDDKVIKNYVDNSTDDSVHIEVFYDDIPDHQLESTLKLTTSLSMNNMHTFMDNKIVKWQGAEELLDRWFEVRSGWYARRKEQQLEVMQQQYDRLYYTVCFLKMVIDGALQINNRKKEDIVRDIEEYEFMRINGTYDYLLNMPIYNFTKEKYDDYLAQAKSKKTELKTFRGIEPSQIWLNDLTELEKALAKQGY
jgi:DNA topoisomerase II